jgi:hypothetical protein
MKKETIHIRARILMPLGLTIFFICFCGFLVTMWFQYQYIEKGVEERLENARTLFVELINIEADILVALSRSYSDYQPLKEAYLNGDRQQLLNRADPLFKEIRKRHEITHFYFHSTDRSCFLRIHNPPRHSDQIDRYTLAQAAHLEEPSFGLEIGPLGTMTLRAVQPWKVDGKIIGFIELGKEIDHITPLLKRVMGLDLVFAIEKNFLNRDLWEEGLRMLNKSGSWDDFNNHIITSSTFLKLPNSLNKDLSNHREGHNRNPFDVYHSGKVFRCGVIPLYDAAGVEVGDIFAFADYTPITSNRNLFIFFATFCFILAAIFMVFLSSYFKKMEKKLHNSMDKLGSIITEREQDPPAPS